MRYKKRLAYIALGCAILLSGVVVLLSSWAQAPGQEEIVFVSTRDVDWEIYVMGADGKNVRRLTNNLDVEGAPAWSPYGQKIAFTSDRDGNEEIYVMDADGKNLRNLTNHPRSDMSPDWFDHALAHAVSSAGKLRGTWGWIKRNRE